MFTETTECCSEETFGEINFWRTGSGTTPLPVTRSKSGMPELWATTPDSTVLGVTARKESGPSYCRHKSMTNPGGEIIRKRRIWITSKSWLQPEVGSTIRNPFFRWTTKQILSTLRNTCRIAQSSLDICWTEKATPTRPNIQFLEKTKELWVNSCQLQRKSTSKWEWWCYQTTNKSLFLNKTRYVSQQFV